MRKHLSARRALLVAPVILVTLAMAGCNYTGGGWMQSSPQLGGTNANFGFTYKQTDSTTGAGLLSGNYIDRDASGNPVVKLSFTGAQTQSANPCMNAQFTYRSTNPAAPGTGQGQLVACDLSGSGPGNGNDYLSISIQSGPYQGYSNAGLLQGGNLTGHK